MKPTYDRDIMEKLAPFLVPVGRTVAGGVLGVVLSMIGIAIAWSLFIFSGVQSIDVWLGSLFFGAGLGAGVGGFAAWLHLDRENGLVLALSVTIIVGFGVLGAWGGYRYGSTQEVECCAMPTVSPVYYTALGATVVANAAAIAIAALRAYLTKKWQPEIQNAVRWVR